MNLDRQKLFQIIGFWGVVINLAFFIAEPSFPTPDKLIIFLFFVFLMLHQATQMLVRLGPFAILLLVYEAFRGIAHELNNHVNYSLAPHMDRLLFGKLPTVTLQDWLWRGHTTWYDVVLYIPYLLFFVVPFGLAILVWKTRDEFYWRVINTYLIVFFAGFLTFLIFPTAPPWLAAQNHYIEPIVRTSSWVWYSLGVHNFTLFYSHVAPNPVAAVPSLHAACSTLLSILVFKIYGKRWGIVSLIYPALLYVGVVYEGEHYAFDVICGIIYAGVGYLVTPYIMRKVGGWWNKIKPAFAGLDVSIRLSKIIKAK